MEELVKKTLGKVREQGRTYFDREENLGELEELQKSPSHIRELITGLNFEDTGLKQPCTALAVILKVGKKHPGESLRVLEMAFKKDEAPHHYLSELIYKINRKKERDEKNSTPSRFSARDSR